MTDATPELTRYSLFSPFLAGAEGQDENSEKQFFEKFSAAPEYIQEFLVASETAEEIAKWADEGVLPDTHWVAVPKLIAYIVFKDVQVSQVRELLSKLNLDTPTVSALSVKIAQLVEPYMDAPTTTKQSSPHTPAALSRIIDLKNIKTP